MKEVIGITGSIGSGKSYAIKIFEEICKKNKIQATFLNVDDIRRNILKQENIDRENLNKEIYSDKEKMKKYKKFINPKIRKELTEQINRNNGLIFIEWALLIEDSFYDIVDKIIMIFCQKDIQIKRLKSSDLGREEIVKRINLQLTNEEKLERIRQLGKKYNVIDTSNNPSIEEYENILKEGKIKYE